MFWGAKHKREGKHPVLLPCLIVFSGFFLFCGLVVWYTTWAVATSEHKWCAVIDTLNAAPGPGASVSGAERQYDARLAYDIHVLKTRLGC